MTFPVWSWPNSTIVRVVDGDSIIGEMTKDIGFHGLVTFQQRLRLNRINAPKIDIGADEYVKSWLNTTVTFETIKPYKYGDEWMVEVTDQNRFNLSDRLVYFDYAVYWDGTGPRPGG